MYQDQADLVWLLPLFLAGLFLLASAGMWWRVANGRNVDGVHIKPNGAHLRQAASVSALCFALLAAAILAFFWVRF